MPANIILRNLTTPPVVATVSPFISTIPGQRDGTRTGGGGGGTGTLLFEDGFDSQTDWVAPEPADWTLFTWAGDSLPTGWNALWNSGDEYPANPNLAIGPSTLDVSGKALKIWREWHSTNTFASNGYIAKLFANDYNEMYIEFEIAFQAGWTENTSAQTKVFRVFSSDRDPVNFFQAFDNGHQGPLTLWDYASSSTYGLRNGLYFRGGPHGENYSMTDADLAGIGRAVSSGSLGDISMNWTEDMQGNLTGGGSPQIPDKLNGGFLPTTGIVSHQQVFGPPGTFTKLGFYVKMNSAPDVPDGIYRQYLDDQLIVDSEAVRWVGPTTKPMPGWNAFGLGGNDSWTGSPWTSADQREELYEIRRVAVFDGLPGGL